MTSQLLIRDEEDGDAEAVRRVERLAFGRDDEADLVDRLRLSCRQRLSLVARLGGEVVGHILFTPALARAGSRQVEGMGLAPLAVLPEHQGKGIGAELTRRGLERLEAAGCPFVIVLGHPEYYPRFGFERASKYGLASEFEGVPDEAFRIRVFDPAAVAELSGVVRYRPEFSSA